jgi:hypothetical protein
VATVVTGCNFPGFKVGNCPQHFAAITENDAQFLQVMIGQVGKNRNINSVFGKTLLLGHAELCEPICDLLHRQPPGCAIIQASDRRKIAT